MVQLDYPVTGNIIEAADHINRESFMLNALISYALDGATTTNQDNMKVDLFGSDTATYLEFMEYNAGTDLYECIDTSVAYYVIIEATSTTATSSGNVIIKQMASGKWIVYATAGTYEVNRAEVMEYLFKPVTYNDGTTAKIVSAFTAITSIKSGDADDVGKQAHWASAACNNVGGGTINANVQGDYDGVFVNTSTNTACSSWSEVSSSGTNSSGAWEMPKDTALNGGGDEFGTDTSADELDNPATNALHVQALYHASNSGDAHVKALILCVGDITWTDNIVVDAGSGGGKEVYNYDFLSTGSIPAITATTESDLTCRITTNSTTITTSETLAICKAVYTLTAGNSIAYEVSFNGGSNWLAITESTLSKTTNTGTSLMFRFTITRATNTETDSITSYGAYYS